MYLCLVCSPEKEVSRLLVLLTCTGSQLEASGSFHSRCHVPGLVIRLSDVWNSLETRLHIVYCTIYAKILPLRIYTCRKSLLYRQCLLAAVRCTMRPAGSGPGHVHGRPFATWAIWLFGSYMYMYMPTSHPQHNMCNNPLSTIAIYSTYVKVA